MKPDNRLLRMTSLRFLTFGLLLAGLVGLSGCMVTNKVLDLRKERETRTKEAINFWSLAAVRSAHVTPGGEVFACAEFRDSPSEEPQEYTINLSQIIHIGKTYADFMPADYSRTESLRRTEAQADLVWYLYPLVEAQKGCGKPTGESPSPVSGLKIETCQIQREEQSQLPAILVSSDRGAAEEDRIIEVSFASEKPGTKAENDLKKRSVAGPSGTKDVLMVYLPAARIEQQVRAIGVVGAFEPGSEWVNPYTLLVAPAVATDVVLDTAIVILAVGVSGGWACGR
jgi:hypothetical protein